MEKGYVQSESGNWVSANSFWGKMEVFGQRLNAMFIKAPLVLAYRCGKCGKVEMVSRSVK